MKYRGVNLAYMSGEPGDGQQVAVPDAIPYYARQGFNLARIPIGPNLLQPMIGGPLDPQWVAGIKRLIKQAQEYSMWVVLDHHSYGQRVIDKVAYPYSSKGPYRPRDMLAWWDLVAQAFPDDNVIFDIDNEPQHPDPWYTFAVQQACITRIRRFRKLRNPIWIEASFWNNSWAFRRSWPDVEMMIDTLKSYSDPLGNLFYSPHVYIDQYSQGGSAAIAPSWQAMLTKALTLMAQPGLPIVVGEVAFGRDPASLAAGKTLMELLDRTTQGFCWLGAGGWPDFRAGGFDLWNWLDPKDWAKPVDREQMAILSPYLK